jgi:hypothetical protein
LPESFSYHPAASLRPITATTAIEMLEITEITTNITATNMAAAMIAAIEITRRVGSPDQPVAFASEVPAAG